MAGGGVERGLAGMTMETPQGKSIKFAGACGSTGRNSRVVFTAGTGWVKIRAMTSSPTDAWPGSSTAKSSGSMNLGSSTQLTRSLRKVDRKIELTPSSAGGDTRVMLIDEETKKP
jgi:hypothetical protein